MIGKKKIFITIIVTLYFVFSFSTLKAQAQWLTSVSHLSDSLFLDLPDTAKTSISNKIQQTLHENLSRTNSFNELDLKELKRIGCILSPDSSFKLISWNFFLKNGNSVCYTILQKKSGSDSCSIFNFNQLKNKDRPNYRFISNKIPAALYYKIIPTKCNGFSAYLLLGMNPGDLFIQSKSIETFYFNENNNPVSGTPIIHINNLTTNRLKFEYSSNYRISMKYDEAKKAIVIDHLSPSNPIQEGKYEFYGPDGSFDALVLQNDEWRFISDYNLFKSVEKHK